MDRLKLDQNGGITRSTRLTTTTTASKKERRKYGMSAEEISPLDLNSLPPTSSTNLAEIAFKERPTAYATDQANADTDNTVDNELAKGDKAYRVDVRPVMMSPSDSQPTKMVSLQGTYAWQGQKELAMPI